EKIQSTDSEIRKIISIERKRREK
ncbi:MAG: hypothetical protein RLZZ517_457, partial [Candidatus Parcubacteria bacterium]